MPISLDAIESRIWSIAPRARSHEVQQIMSLIETWGAKAPIPRECGKCRDGRLNKRRGADGNRYTVSMHDASGRKIAL